MHLLGKEYNCMQRNQIGKSAFLRNNTFYMSGNFNIIFAHLIAMLKFS